MEELTLRPAESRWILRIGLIVSVVVTSALGADVVLLDPKILQDGSVFLRWQSETGAIYSAESAETLSPGEYGVVSFDRRDDQIVSQGSETTWLDYGDASALPRIYHPFDMPMRFYRVIKTEQSTNPPVSVTLVQPTTGAVLSGDAIIEVSINTTNPVGLLRLFVDGQAVDEEFGVDTFEFSINTTEWINGQHVLHVTAELLSESGTTGDPGDPQPEQPAIGSSPSVSVVFDNLIHDFTVVNPNFDPYDPYSPEYQVIYASFITNCDWTLDIVDENDVPVDGYYGSGTDLYVPWDGSDFHYNPLPPGFYDYIITATVQGSSLLADGADESALAASSSTEILRKSEAMLTERLRLIINPTNRATRVMEIASTRPTGLVDEFRSELQLPESAYATRQNGRPSSPRTPWFMQLKPDESASDFDWSELVIPPIPPLPYLYFEEMPDDWEQILADYLVWSNNIVESAYLQAVELVLLQEERAAAWEQEATFVTTSSESDGPQSQYAASSQSTRNPRREPGRTQMSWVGGVGAMSQGHHPSQSWSYGPLMKANLIAQLWIKQMEKGSTTTKFPSWKKSFHLTDNQVQKTNMVGTGYTGSGIYTTNSWFNRYANMGMLVGHTLEYNPPGWPLGTFGPLAAYPLYNSALNPDGYTWVPDAEMRFGSQSMKWMAYYGCNVLTRSRWYGGAKDHFYWPLEPYLNLYLATGSTIYMYDEVGRLWAKGMQGELNGTPMTIVSAGVEAGRRAHAEEAKSRTLGTIRFTYLYWDARQEGGAYTFTDKLKPFTANFSLVGRSYENLEYDDPVVYSP